MTVAAALCAVFWLLVLWALGVPWHWAAVAAVGIFLVLWVALTLLHAAGEATSPAEGGEW